MQRLWNAATVLGIGLALVLTPGCLPDDEDTVDIGTLPAAPGTMGAYRDRVGQRFQFRATGTTSGDVWGGANGVYSDDSTVAKAAVHAGVLRAGETGAVTVRVLAGQSNYQGSTRNGITTSNWGAWGGSYRFE